MKARSTKPIRLDQAVSNALLRLGGLVAVAVVLAVAANLWRSALYANADRYIAASQALATSHAGMLDQETGLRGFLDDRSPELLQPYMAGLDELSRGDAALSQEIGDDPSMLTDYVSLRLAQNTWQSQWAAPATGARPADLAGFLAQGKSLFDAYRATESRMNTDIIERVHADETQANIAAVGGLATELAVFLFAGLLWWRTRRDLRRAVLGPVAAILAGLERIDGGEYGLVEPLDTGPDELQAISRRLATVSARLEGASAGVRQREQEAADHAARLRLIVDMGHEIAGSLNLRYVLQAVSDSVVGIGAFARCIIWLTDEANSTLLPTHDSAGAKGRVAGLEPIPVGEQTVGRAARFGRVVGPEEVSHPGASDTWHSALAVPMIVGARVVGVIEISMDGRAELAMPVMELVHTLSSQAATAVEAARLYEQSEQRGRTDALTLLPNRRELDRALATEVSRAQRYGRSLAVAMVDIDHFKKVNDQQGHARGDEVLQDTAAVMRAMLREVDTVYRYGGEEFLILMPETPAESAVEMCDRLRVAVSERVTVHGSATLTISCGVAGFPRDGTDAARLVGAADEALYRAKRGGRNRVVLATPEITVAPRSA